MTIELRRPAGEDVPALGEICYHAFRDIAESHGLPPDFPTIEFGQQIVGMLLAQEQVYGTAAYDDGRPCGSNCINMWGDVAGIGPISVEIARQGGGIGRRLMRDVIDHARGQGIEMIRLCQDAFNMRSLALYASLGFDTKEPLAYLALNSAIAADPGFRPATADDLDAMDELCRPTYRVSRKGECRVLMQLGFPAFVLERAGHVSGYLIGTIIGHGVAESDDEMLALLAGLGASVPGAQSLVPIRSGELYRRALSAGHRNIKTMNLMALGPYDDPRGTWMPSVMF